jgi:hypothetical protein
VDYLDRRKGKSQSGRKIDLKEVLSRSEINKKYPHTVGFFLASSGRGLSWKPDYLRVKKVSGIKEFHDFLRELGL